VALQKARRPATVSNGEPHGTDLLGGKIGSEANSPHRRNQVPRWTASKQVDVPRAEFAHDIACFMFHGGWRPGRVPVEGGTS
jgi:hypothetical protein